MTVPGQCNFRQLRLFSKQRLRGDTDPRHIDCPGSQALLWSRNAAALGKVTNSGCSVDGGLGGGKWLLRFECLAHEWSS